MNTAPTTPPRSQVEPVRHASHALHLPVDCNPVGEASPQKARAPAALHGKRMHKLLMEDEAKDGQKVDVHKRFCSGIKE